MKRKVHAVPRLPKHVKLEVPEDIKLEPELLIEPKLELKQELELEPQVEVPDVKNTGIPPSNWKTFIERVREMRSLIEAPVDTMGSSKIGAREKDKLDEKTVRFQHLVALMLSSQTLDQITSAAVDRLRLRLEPTLTPQALLNIDETELANILNPVGFYRRKANYLKRAAQICIDKYDGDIPRTLKEIVALPGVGPKMGMLLLQSAWGEVHGIGVDVHVHRIANMWGWVPKSEHPTPEKTRKGLEEWLPREMWREINPLLVGFGQTWCPSRGSKAACSACLLNDLCPVRKR